MRVGVEWFPRRKIGSVAGRKDIEQEKPTAACSLHLPSSAGLRGLGDAPLTPVEGWRAVRQQKPLAKLACPFNYMFIKQMFICSKPQSWTEHAQGVLMDKLAPRKHHVRKYHRLWAGRSVKAIF